MEPRFIPAQAGNTWRPASASIGTVRAGRFIPAQAGNTFTVHPGGEHRRVRTPSRPGVGSSPRRRGTHQRPANGSSPRRRGTHAAVAERRTGSSPRRRGTRRCEAVYFIPARRGTHRIDRHDGDRFIPAQAGNTSCAPRANAIGRRTVHPRAGGEHAAPATVDDDCRERFIPAQAGNTLDQQGTGRVRTRLGSSPRRRGTHQATPKRRSSLPAPVHPRAGGEHAVIHGVGSHSRSGSSPRRRGTLFSQPIESERFL